MMIDLHIDELDSQAYYEWLSKFEAKKTTDDCYTPPLVYDAVLKYVSDEIINLDDLKVIRPFYPNGDYTDLSQYDDKTIVIDNPPFSLSAKIYKFYQDNNIKFFLFAPSLTVFSPMRKIDGITAVIAPHDVTYANGAVINTAFTTNLTPHLKAFTAPKLQNALEIADNKSKNTVELPKYAYPQNIVMVNNLKKICKAGFEVSIQSHESKYISHLESQKKHGKNLFGGGLIVSDEVAKEIQAKEIQAKEIQAKEIQAKKEAIIWYFSDHELQVIDKLNKAALDAVFNT